MTTQTDREQDLQQIAKLIVTATREDKLQCRIVQVG